MISPVAELLEIQSFVEHTTHKQYRTEAVPAELNVLLDFTDQSNFTVKSIDSTFIAKTILNSKTNHRSKCDFMLMLIENVFIVTLTF